MSTAEQKRFVRFTLGQDPHESYRHIISVAAGVPRHVSAAAKVTPLDHDLFKKTLEDGGFTHSPTEGSPTRGYATSLELHGDQAKEIHVSDLTPQHIADHRAALSDHLKTPGVHQGGWYDRNSGHVYLDASKIHSDEGEARNEALNNKQKAYYSLHDGHDVFINKHLDPLKGDDVEAWNAKYKPIEKKFGTEIDSRYHGYRHLYDDPKPEPETDQKKLSRWRESERLLVEAKQRAKALYGVDFD